MKIQQSTEDYLENILILTNELGSVRSIDIVNEMWFTKPSVSIAMKKLRETNLIKMDADGYITLTEEGLAKAKAVYDRHVTLAAAFMEMGVSEKTAMEDACRVEHVISEETFEKIREMTKHGKENQENAK